MPKIKKKTEKETVIIEDDELAGMVTRISRKASKEIAAHIRSLDKDALWDMNKEEIFAEIMSHANQGSRSANIHDILTEVEGTKTIVRTNEAYDIILRNLNSIGFAANLRQHPTMGPFIAITWPA